MRRVRVTFVAVGKQWKLRNLVIQHEMRMRHIIIRGLTQALQFYFYLCVSHKMYDFRKNVIDRKMCVSILSITFIWNIFKYKKNWARYGVKCIQDVPGGKVNILGGHSIGHSKQQGLYEHVSYSEWFPS
jgi:hypothetical protein